MKSLRELADLYKRLFNFVYLSWTHVRLCSGELVVPTSKLSRLKFFSEYQAIPFTFLNQNSITDPSNDQLEITKITKKRFFFI